MKIISYSDVITNSSSEVFLCVSHCKAEDLKKQLEVVHKDGYSEFIDAQSGMGGVFNISDWTIPYISSAASMWEIRMCMTLGIWEDRINDPNDPLTWDHVSKYYEKYPDITEKEFSYTVEDWMKEFNLTDEEVINLIYLRSDSAQKATRTYIENNCIFLFNEYEEGKLPYPREGSKILEYDNSSSFKSSWSCLKKYPDFAKYVISQIESSKFTTFINYNIYLK